MPERESCALLFRMRKHSIQLSSQGRSTTMTCLFTSTQTQWEFLLGGPTTDRTEWSRPANQQLRQVFQLFWETLWSAAAEETGYKREFFKRISEICAKCSSPGHDTFPHWFSERNNKEVNYRSKVTGGRRESTWMSRKLKLFCQILLIIKKELF